MPGRSRRLPLLVFRAGLTATLAFSPGLSAFGAEASALRRAVTPRAAQAGNLGPAARGEGAGSWWFGTAGVALALALCGWGCVVSRRYLPKAGTTASTTMRVVGRTSLSPKHTVYLLDVGGRVLIVGTGAQGAPSLLGELDEPGDLTRVAPGASVAVMPRFDHRLTEDEG